MLGGLEEVGGRLLLVSMGEGSVEGGKEERRSVEVSLAPVVVLLPSSVQRNIVKQPASITCY